MAEQAQQKSPNASPTANMGQSPIALLTDLFGGGGGQPKTPVPGQPAQPATQNMMIPATIIPFLLQNLVPGGMGDGLGAPQQAGGQQPQQKAQGQEPLGNTNYGAPLPNAPWPKEMQATQDMYDANAAFRTGLANGQFPELQDNPSKKKSEDGQKDQAAKGQKSGGGEGASPIKLIADFISFLGGL